jgi:peptidoglycan/xylan/chitin deacetylase (PgdA/CDA1 family)
MLEAQAMRRGTLLPALFVVALGGCGGDEGPGLSQDEINDLWEKAYEEEKDGKADNAACSGVVVPDRGRFDKVVALTFDDGPKASTTPVIMDILRRQEVPGTFFANGNKIVASSEAERIAEEIATDPGLILGNHTWSHKKMTSLSSGAAAAQIDDTTQAIEDVGGRPRFFRFPFGASNCSTSEMVKSRGYAVTGWHIDSADWCFAASPAGRCPESTFRYVDDDVRDDMPAYVMRQAKSRGGGILLFHDIHSYTTDALEGIIEMLKDAGYRFTGIDDETVFPRLNDVPERDDGNDTADDDNDDNDPADGDRARVTGTGGSGLRLRAGPGTNFEILAVIPEGEVVELLGDSRDGWYELRYDGTTGWSSGRYLEPL